MSEAIIDAHHHIWRLAETPWLDGPPVPRIFGDYAPLRRDWSMEDLAADFRAQGVARSVYIQVNVAPGGEVAEVEWVQSVADRHGFPHGIVGYADLTAPDAGAVLDREMRCANLRGIRQQLHWHETPLYRFAARPDVMNDAAFRRGMAELERRGLLFELQIFAPQMADAARLAREFPGVPFVLLHAGMPEDRGPAGRARWREGMKLLAACPNVSAKLSGLGTFEHRCSVELWKPVVEETLALFGPDRCLFGSNYPIESLWTTYARIVEVMRECAAGLAPAERRAVFHDTAQRLYRL
ncbi:MAG: amidohydrolase family protein [Burkholderiales bacterium]|nr:amidohydrolase family protein [Burkholderiales bacterium]